MRFFLRIFSSLGLSLIVLMLALPAQAQNRIIKGRVTDEKNKPIAEAAITIQAVETKATTFHTKTDKKGDYIHVGLPAEKFYVIARAKGFAPNYAAARPSISQESVVDLVLTPGNPDQKLAIEMTAQELEQAKKEMEMAERNKQLSAELQSLFDSGRELAEQRKYTEAIDLYKKALEKDPKQTSIIAYMAEAYSKLNNNDEALELYKKAIAIQPNNASLYTNMGVLLSNMGKNAESEEAFSKASSLNPATSAQNHYNIGVTMFNSGRVAEGAEEFRKAIAADPNFAEAYYQLGMCLAGNPESAAEAVKAFQKYIQIGKKPEQIDVAKQMVSALKGDK